jgi:hypothetical protein
MDKLDTLMETIRFHCFHFCTHDKERRRVRAGSTEAAGR